MNKFNRMWQAVNPSSDEIEGVRVAFEGLDATDLVPRLVMVRRAVAACFYTDDLTKQENLSLGPESLYATLALPAGLTTPVTEKPAPRPESLAPSAG